MPWFRAWIAQRADAPDPSNPLGQERHFCQYGPMALPADNQPSGMPEVTGYLPALRRYVARQVLRDDVDDIVQEIMLRLHQRQSEEPIDNVTGYVFQVAASVVTDRHRRDRVRHRDAHESLEEFHHNVEQLTPERVLIGREELFRLAAALDAMPERHRDVFVLHRFEHMSYGEIAQHLGVSISLVGKDMMKALQFLAKRDLP